MRDDRELLKDMQEAIERIEKYLTRGRDSLAGDELIQVWLTQRAVPNEWRNNEADSQTQGFYPN